MEKTTEETSHDIFIPLYFLEFTSIMTLYLCTMKVLSYFIKQLLSIVTYYIASHKKHSTMNQIKIQENNYRED